MSGRAPSTAMPKVSWSSRHSGSGREAARESASRRGPRPE
jgi:hypothetical protein